LPALRSLGEGGRISEQEQTEATEREQMNFSCLISVVSVISVSSCSREFMDSGLWRSGVKNFDFGVIARFQRDVAEFNPLPLSSLEFESGDFVKFIPAH
jgi:hypothetical protein